MATQAVARRRGGLSLLELLVVVTLMGVFASATMMRLGRDVFGDSGARSESRVMSLALLRAQRAAIRTGDAHGLVVSTMSGTPTWTVLRRSSGGSETVVDGPHAVIEEVTLSTNRNQIWFDFEGSGSELFTASLSGKHRSYAIRVEPLTRMIRMQETTP